MHDGEMLIGVRVCCVVRGIRFGLVFSESKAQDALRKGFHCKAMNSRLEVLLVVALGNIYHFDMRLSDLVFVAATFHIVPIPFWTVSHPNLQIPEVGLVITLHEYHRYSRRGAERKSKFERRAFPISDPRCLVGPVPLEGEAYGQASEQASGW